MTIEEYGGIENNLRLENELYTFAIITTSATECFSAETPQELTDWTNLIQEYLGKGMNESYLCVGQVLILYVQLFICNHQYFCVWVSGILSHS